MWAELKLVKDGGSERYAAERRFSFVDRGQRAE